VSAAKTIISSIIFMTCLGSGLCETVTVLNRSTQNIKVSLYPDKGAWQPLNDLTPSERGLATSLGGGWKDFFLPKGEGLQAECFGCSSFKYNSGIIFPNLQSLQLGASYQFGGGNPVFQLHSSVPPTELQGLNVLAFMPWQHFYFYREPQFTHAGMFHIPIPLKPASVVVEKPSGAWWVDSEDIIGATKTIAAGAGFSHFVCGNCGGSLKVLSINGDPISAVITPEGGYPIVSEGEKFAISQKTLQPPPRGPLAPASAAGELYIVNGRPDPINFVILSGLDDLTSKMPAEVSLLGREGQSFHCNTQCVVEIGTGSTSIKRSVQPGKSYIIALDTTTNVYDLRIYSQ
jgi:hypothetical protein